MCCIMSRRSSHFPLLWMPSFTFGWFITMTRIFLRITADDLQITIQDLEDMIQSCKGNKTEKSTDVSEKHNWSTPKSYNKEV